MKRKTWPQLTADEQEQVCYILVAFEECRLALGLRNHFDKRVPQGSMASSPIQNLLYVYAVRFLLANGNNLVRALEHLGHDDLSDSAKAVLDRQLGKASLREVLRVYRNQFFEHP